MGLFRRLMLIIGLSLAGSAFAGGALEASEAERATIDELATMLRAVGHDLKENQRTAEQYVALADWMDTKLDRLPGTDASSAAARAFKEVDAQLRRATQLMREATKVQARWLGYRIAVQALNEYGQRFAHPGWAPVPEVTPAQ